MCDVQHRAVLDVAARADADEIDVAAGHRAGPERDIVAQLDIADHNRGCVDVDLGAEPRQPSAVGSDVHSHMVAPGNIALYWAVWMHRCRPPRA